MSSSERELRERLSGFKATFSASKDTAERKKLSADIRRMQADLDDLTGIGLRLNPPPKTPMPKTYLEQRRAKIDATHKVSKFASVGRHIVQGGKANGK